MQVEEYRERLAAGAEIAADAVGGTVAAVETNGDRGAAEGSPARAAQTVASGTSAGAEEDSKTTA
jgi:hypothetical protein